MNEWCGVLITCKPIAFSSPSAWERVSWPTWMCHLAPLLPNFLMCKRRREVWPEDLQGLLQLWYSVNLRCHNYKKLWIEDMIIQWYISCNPVVSISTVILDSPISCGFKISWFWHFKKFLMVGFKYSELFRVLDSVLSRFWFYSSRDLWIWGEAISPRIQWS